VARAAIRGALSGHPPPAPIAAPDHPALLRPAGCFVSLHEIGSRRLRGCVGRLESHSPVVVTVHESAINVLSDSRFLQDPITPDELARLDIELSVLSPLQPAPGCLHFDPAMDGILLTVGAHSGCFLPQVARDTGWGREQLLDRLCSEKLGLPAQAWKNPPAMLHTFSAHVIGPVPFLELDPGAGDNHGPM
jgi:AmmeMemoRadiSam system protein A